MANGQYPNDQAKPGMNAGSYVAVDKGSQKSHGKHHLSHVLQVPPSAILLDNVLRTCYIAGVSMKSVLPSLGLRAAVRPKPYVGPRPVAEHPQVALGAIQQVVFNGEAK